MKTAIHLKPTDRVRISGIVMQFYYWLGTTPVFTHTQNSTQINYINQSFTEHSEFEIA